MHSIKELIQEIKDKKSDLYQKDFLLSWKKTRDELDIILDVAEALKILHQNNISTRCFDSGLAISQFRDNSTRTRFSFASAANLLGLEVQDLDEGKSQISHGETVRETAVMISFLSEIIGIRDDMYLGEGNAYMREVGNALNDAFEQKVINQRPGIVNLQCDIDHPTQAMADLLHLKKTFGSLGNLKGKKIAMTWAYSPSYGKPLSVPQGIIGLMTRFGMEVELAYPEGYHLIPEITELAGKQAGKTGGSFRISHSMDEAFSNADIVYPKSWAPFTVMQQRTIMLNNNDTQGLKELEKICLENNAQFKDWECTEEKMKLTRNGNALYMHCLPADISGVSCAQGEVSSSVFDKYRTPLYKQAGFKPFVIAAMMLTNRFENPAALLEDMLDDKTARKYMF